VCETIPRLIALAGTDVVLRPLPVPLGAAPLLARAHELSGYLVEHRESNDLRSEIDLWASGQYNRAFLAEYGCLLPLRDLTVEPNGDVYPCSASTSFRPDHVVGNVRHASLAAIRRSGALRAFYRNVGRHDCCARCHASSNMSDGSYLVRTRPDAVPASLWPALAFGSSVAPC
jgi:radical SAM protein with 4Fe4S-binding SPASM domain